MNGVTVRIVLMLALLGGGLPWGSLQAQNINWSSVGPSNQGGRIRALAFDGNGGLWACAVGGGLWRSTNNGTSWSPVSSFSNLPASAGTPCLAASSIAISGNKIYVGTGEMYFRYNSSFSQVVPQSLTQMNTDGRTYPGMIGPPGQGVFVSTDGGATFNHINATWGLGGNLFDVSNPWLSVQKLVVRGNRVFAATLHGLYYTDDDFQTVTLADNQTPTGGQNDPGDLETVAVLDIELGAGNIVYASTNECTYISYDNGATFTKRLYRADLPRDPFGGNTDNPPGRSRVELAVAPSNPAVVYITEANNNGLCLGVWKSTDSGDTWTRVGPRTTAPNINFAPFYSPIASAFAGGSSGYGKYAIAFAVNPTNPDKIYLGGEEWYTYSPTQGWSQNQVHNVQYYPADPKFLPRAKHCIVFNPNNANQFYVGSDFGVTRSDDDGGYFFQASNGLRGTCAFSVAPNVDGELLISTSNGTAFREATGTSVFQQRSQSLTLAQIAPSSFFPDEYVVGLPNSGSRRTFDGGVVFEEYYGYPQTDLAACLGTGYSNAIGHLSNTFYSGPALTPIVFDEQLVHPQGMVQDTFGKDTMNARYVFTATTEGVWLVGNPFYSLQEQDSINFWQRITPLFSVAGYGVPSAITVSGEQNHVVYVGTDAGRIFRIYHAHNPCSPEYNFSEITPPNQFWDRRGYVSALAVDPTDPNIVVATMGGYVPEDFRFDGTEIVATSKIAVLKNGMDVAGTPQWLSQNIVDGVLPPVPIYDVVFNPNPNPSSRGWYAMLATEYGVFTCQNFNLNDGDTTGISDEIWTEQNFGEMKRVQVYDLSMRKYRFYPVTYPGTLKRSFHVAPLADAELYAATFGLGILRTNVAVGADESQAAARPEREASLALYPNPANQVAHLRLRAEGSATVRAQVLSVTGQQVMELPAQTLDGRQSLQFSTADLPAGIYMVHTWVEVPGAQPVQQTHKLVVRH